MLVANESMKDVLHSRFLISLDCRFECLKTVTSLNNPKRAKTESVERNRLDHSIQQGELLVNFTFQQSPRMRKIKYSFRGGSNVIDISPAKFHYNYYHMLFLVQLYNSLLETIVNILNYWTRLFVIYLMTVTIFVIVIKIFTIFQYLEQKNKKK